MIWFGRLGLAVGVLGVFLVMRFTHHFVRDPGGGHTEWTPLLSDREYRLGVWGWRGIWFSFFLQLIGTF